MKIDAQAVLKQASKAVARPLKLIAPVYQGRNSQVYHIQDESDGASFVLKCYFEPQLEKRSRLRSEVNALRALERGAIDQVPRILWESPASGAVLMSFISGVPGNLSPQKDLFFEQGISFLRELIELGRRDSALQTTIGPAADATFSLAGITEQIKTRMNLLLQSEVPEDSEIRASMKEFLKGSLGPAFVEYERKAAISLGADALTELSIDERVLSPSDFGWHNAIWQPHGRFAFVDFEYFGWDDPVKLLSDTLLHPAMNFEMADREAFLSAFLGQIAFAEGFRRRLRAYFPLFGVKWALILLNEFRPHQLERRRFAGGGGQDTASLLKSQLDKSRSMLEKVSLI